MDMPIPTTLALWLRSMEDKRDGTALGEAVLQQQGVEVTQHADQAPALLPASGMPDDDS
jgi:hypothetical protein